MQGYLYESPALAFTDAEAVRLNFLRCLDALFDGGSYVAAATHDDRLIGESLQRSVHELQVLLGVREDRAREFGAARRRLRVYVLFGERWYEYSLRCLQENAAMAAKAVARATIATIGHRGKRVTPNALRPFGRSSAGRWRARRRIRRAYRAMPKRVTPSR